MAHYRCFEPPLVRPGQAIHRYSRAPLPICSRIGSTSTLCCQIATANPEFRPTFTVSPGARSSPTRRPSCSRSERPARRHSARLETAILISKLHHGERAISNRGTERPPNQLRHYKLFSLTRSCHGMPLIKSRRWPFLFVFPIPLSKL